MKIRASEGEELLGSNGCEVVRSGVCCLPVDSLSTSGTRERESGSFSVVCEVRQVNPFVRIHMFARFLSLSSKVDGHPNKTIPHCPLEAVAHQTFKLAGNLNLPRFS